MIARQLVGEFQLLEAHPSARDGLTFACRPFEAYTLVAALQAASRHPGLSDIQRTIVVGLAGQLAAGLIAAMLSVSGPGSAIERTLYAGFDREQDVDGRL